MLAYFAQLIISLKVSVFQNPHYAGMFFYELCQRYRSRNLYTFGIFPTFTIISAGLKMLILVVTCIFSVIFMSAVSF